MRSISYLFSVYAFICATCCHAASAPITTNLDFMGPQLTFDYPEVFVGTADYENGPTGTTVIYFPQGAQAVVDVMGGSTGTYFTEPKMMHGQAYIDAITLSGGGILGLEAAAGVTSALFTRNPDSKFADMPLVSGAVIFDFTQRPKSKIYPDKALGQAALQAAQTGRFPIGAVGAGRSATHSKILSKPMPSGQGAAFAEVEGTKIAVFTVVNALGYILDEHYISWPDQLSDQQLNEKAYTHLQKVSEQTLKGNTTLSVVVINQPLSPWQMKQLAKQIHHSFAQVIQPYGTMLDGDVLYLVSTAQRSATASVDIYYEKPKKEIALGMIASSLVKEAVWQAVGKGHANKESKP